MPIVTEYGASTQYESAILRVVAGSMPDFSPGIVVGFWQMSHMQALSVTLNRDYLCQVVRMYEKV